MAKRVLGICIAITIMISLCPSLPEASASSIRLNKTKISIDEGECYVLKVKGIKKKVKWSSSDKSIAVVTNRGKVIGYRPGKTTITAKVAKKKLKCSVTVNEVEDETARILTERFDIVARVLMNRGTRETDENGDSCCAMTPGIQHTDFYDDDGELHNVWYWSNFLYYPEDDLIDFEFSFDYTSPDFDYDNDKLKYGYVRIDGDHPYTCSARFVDYYTLSSGDRFRDASDISGVDRSSIFHDYNNLSWDIENEVFGSESWKISNAAVNSSLDLWYTYTDRYLDKIIGYKLTDLGFSY